MTTKTKSTKKSTAKKAAPKKTRVLVLGHADAKIIRAGGAATNMSYTDDKAVAAIRSGRFHALLLTGGSDVSPSLYGAEVDARTQYPNERRDLVETLCLEAAVEQGLPVLGICRGAQVLNAVMGGTLNQHIPALPGTGTYHLGHDHDVRSAKGSRLRGAFGQVHRTVVSIHHQSVKAVAPGFVATGWAPDGIIECVESVEGWMVGVQFHPEMSGRPGMQELFDALVAAAARHAGNPPPKRQPAVYAAPRKLNTSSSTFKPQPASPKARVRRDPLQTYERDVATRSRCFRCAMDFDERADYVDHMFFFHDVELMGRDKSKVGDDRSFSDRDLADLEECDMWEGVEAE